MKIFAAAKASLVFIKSRCRSSRSQMFFKIDVLTNFAVFTGKHLCWSLFQIKLQAFECFPVNIAKFLRAAFLQNTSGGYFFRCSVLYYIFQKTLLIILQLQIAFVVLKPKINLIRFHSLLFVVPLVVIRCNTHCHSLSLVITCCHSLSLVVLLAVTRCTTRCHLLYHSLSFVVTRCHSLSLMTY